MRSANFVNKDLTFPLVSSPFQGNWEGEKPPFKKQTYIKLV